MAEHDIADLAKLEYFKNELQHHETLSTAVVSLAQAVLRVSFLLNGGAVIAALSVYSAKIDGTVMPAWALASSSLCWIVGLVASAIATGRTTRAQREFQVNAGNKFRQTGRDYFNLPIPANDDNAEPDIEQGKRFRAESISWWRASIVAFILGSAVAVIGLVFFAAERANG